MVFDVGGPVTGFEPDEQIRRPDRAQRPRYEPATDQQRHTGRQGTRGDVLAFGCRNPGGDDQRARSADRFIDRADGCRGGSVEQVRDHHLFPVATPLDTISDDGIGHPSNTSEPIVVDAGRTPPDLAAADQHGFTGHLLHTSMVPSGCDTCGPRCRRSTVNAP